MISLSALGRPIFLGALILFLSCGLNAAPPKTLDYQGYLANSGGVPLTGSVNLSVSLYAAASGGTSLWTQAGSPTLSNGRFTLVLDGSAGNPFPASAFDQQLYVGLTVDTDPEMTPRQPLTSVASAFEAINADTVDGLEANEIIAAASDEVRTPISSLPFTINTPGSYYLTQNLTATAPNGAQLGQIDINANNITIDLMGFTLDGNGVNDYGINLDTRSKVVIKNGTVEAFGLAGIYNGGSTGAANVLSDLQVVGNGSLGSANQHSGIHLTSSSNRVERCIAKDNGGSGIFVSSNSIVKDSIAENSGGTYGIFGSSGSTLVNNTAFSNAGWGIYASASNNVIGNTVYFNNQSQAGNRGGLRIGADSLAKDNTADNNYDTGIYVNGSGNVLRNNHATDSFTVGANNRCFNFVSSDNAAVGNSANGCSTEFAGAVIPAARFIENIAW